MKDAKRDLYTVLRENFPSYMIYKFPEVNIVSLAGSDSESIYYDCIVNNGIHCFLIMQKKHDDNVLQKALHNYIANDSEFAIRLIGLTVVNAKKLLNCDKPRIAVIVEKSWKYVHRPLRVQMIYSQCFNIANALSYLHRSTHEKSPMLHLNIKLDNLRVVKGNSVKLDCFRDFKVIDLHTSNLTRSKPKYAFTGDEEFTTDLSFMAPEVRDISSYTTERKLSLTPAYDIFSFGCLLQTMITCKPVCVDQDSLLNRAREKKDLSALEGINFVDNGEMAVMLRICYHCLKVDRNLRVDNGIILEYLLKEAYKLDMVRFAKRSLYKFLIFSHNISPEIHETVLQNYQKAFLKNPIMVDKPQSQNLIVQARHIQLLYNLSEYMVKIPNYDVLVKTIRFEVSVMNYQPFTQEHVAQFNNIVISEHIIDMLLLEMKKGNVVNLEIM